MSDQVKVPRAALKRLPLYHRLVSSSKSKGTDHVNSKAISDALQIDSATIRRDFSYFGGLSKKGYGYNIDGLLDFFKSELSESDMIKITIVGVENLGKALLIHSLSIYDDMTTTEAFDVKGDVIGQKIGNVIVKDNDESMTTLKKEEIDVVTLTTPERVAQEVADELVQAGVKSISNFIPGGINMPSDMQVHQIDLGIELQSLLFFMKNHSE